jgi:hypothetical protein
MRAFFGDKRRGDGVVELVVVGVGELFWRVE